MNPQNRIRSNYHTHCSYCDGQGVQEDYVKRAIELDYLSLGFSSHAPLPFPVSWVMKAEDLAAYSAEATRLKSVYADRIQLYTGLEIDYVPGAIAPAADLFPGVALDFVIGSVHFVQREAEGPHYEVDGPIEEFRRHLQLCCDGDARRLARAYFENLRRMLAESPPDVAGHFDVVRKNNRGDRFFDENAAWYRDAALTALEEAKKQDVIVEVNTGAIARGYGELLYPDHWLLREAKHRGVRVGLNADAHDPAHLNAGAETARSALLRAGYTERWILLDGEWKPVPV